MWLEPDFLSEGKQIKQQEQQPNNTHTKPNCESTDDREKSRKHESSRKLHIPLMDRRATRGGSKASWRSLPCFKSSRFGPVCLSCSGCVMFPSPRTRTILNLLTWLGDFILKHFVPFFFFALFSFFQF